MNRGLRVAVVDPHVRNWLERHMPKPGAVNGVGAVKRAAAEAEIDDRTT